MSEFFKKLNSCLSNSINNNYADNYDEDRFGKRKSNSGLKELIRRRINKSYLPKYILSNVFHDLSEISGTYAKRFDLLYNNLTDEKSKQLLIEIWCYRLLKEKHVKLSVNNSYYWETLGKIKALENKKETINPNFIHYKLSKFNLSALGKKVEMYYMATGILLDFFLEQYSYKGPDTVIEAKAGDTVIDAGGCWGDTALYFASKVGPDGSVFSFEFIPANIEIFNKNISLNPALSGMISLIENPVWNVSGQEVFFTNNGPASKLSLDNFDGSFGSKYTVAIDDLVLNKGLKSVDFIKMDIEGAELSALEGAKETIKRFKPNLAIAIYHSIDDFVNIPKWILDLDLGYKLYLGHYTIHQEETILFATIND